MLYITLKVNVPITKIIYTISYRKGNAVLRVSEWSGHLYGCYTSLKMSKEIF